MNIIYILLAVILGINILGVLTLIIINKIKKRKMGNFDDRYYIKESDFLKKINGTKIDYVAALLNKDVRNIFIFIISISMLYHGVDRWLGVYLSRVYHLNQLTISLLFGLIAVSAACGQFFGGQLTDKKGRLFSCRAGLWALSLATMLLAGVYPLFVLSIILVLFALGWTVGHNGVSTVLTDFPDQFRLEIASLNSSLRFLAGGVGFSISGIFVEKSFGLTFLVIGILMYLLSLTLKRVIPQN